MLKGAVTGCLLMFVCSGAVGQEKEAVLGLALQATEMAIKTKDSVNVPVKLHIMNLGDDGFVFNGRVTYRLIEKGKEENVLATATSKGFIEPKTAKAINVEPGKSISHESDIEFKTPTAMARKKYYIEAELEGEMDRTAIRPIQAIGNKE